MWDDDAVERDPVIFFLFPAFFPQIVSGPIQRPGPFFAQMREIAGRTLNFDQIEAGFRFILGGLMMKLLIGDRLLAFIGVPFEAACLAFHETKRVLTTASSEQVRQPLYRDALEYWRNYEPWLGPLKAALGPVLDAYPEVPVFD